MKFQGKALYNLLRMNWLNDPSIKVESWQVIDYRKWTQDQLFKRLEQIGLNFDLERLAHYVDQCENPEELVECLEPNEEHHDEGYLILFEIWRRFFPQNPSLSIFCDEIDHIIQKFDDGEEIDTDDVVEQLRNLENIIDVNIDHGSDPKKIFQFTSTYFAHDLEGFIYDFITELLESDHETLASEILDGFYEYVNKTLWFDFLRFRLVTLHDVDEGNFMLSRIIETIAEEPDYDLYIEIFEYLLSSGRFTLFIALFPTTLKLVEREEQFQELLTLLKEYYEYLESEENLTRITSLLSLRESKDPLLAIDPSDKALATIKQLVEKS